MKNIFKDCRILIVDDDLVGRAVLTKLLKRQGFRFVEQAENGQQGLTALHRQRPMLAVVDIQMPGMDGFEFCRRVRRNADPTIANIPILVQTALVNPKAKAAVFLAGASDYISKPIDPQEFLARAQVHIERELMTQELRDFNSRVKEELEIARSTQHVLFPAAELIKETELRHNVSVSGHWQTCSELGGDFWSLKTISEDAFALFTVDFSGHGVNAALNTFRLQALIHAVASKATEPGAFLMQLNAVLEPLLPVGQFATMFYGVIDTKRGCLSYASAGAPPAILFHSHGYRPLDCSGGLLGAWKDTLYETKEVPFRQGECLLLYSDALIETPDTTGRTFSLENAAEVFSSEFRGGSCQPALGALFDHFNRHYAPKLKDDLTLVACARPHQTD